MKMPNYLELPLRLLRYLFVKCGNKVSSPLKYARLKIVGTGNRIKVSDQLTFSDAVRMSIKIHGNDNTIRIGKIGVKGRLWISIGGGSRNVIELSDGVRVIEQCRIEMLKHCKGGRVSVGPDTTFRSVSIRNYDHGSSVDIGRDCMFSYGILITNTDEHAICQDGKLTNAGHQLRIGDHVWVGIDAMIFKNSHVGDNSIVAARACVSGKFSEEGVVLAGVPARIAKRNVVWSRKDVNRFLGNEPVVSSAMKLLGGQNE